MNKKQLPFFALIKQATLQVVPFIRAYPVLCLVTFLIALFNDEYFLSWLTDNTLDNSSSIYNFANGYKNNSLILSALSGAFFMLPMEITAYRFSLLKQRNFNIFYFLQNQFFWKLIGYTFIIFIFLVLNNFFTRESQDNLRLFVSLIILIFFALMFVRFCLIFPALCVEKKDFTLKQSFKITSGHFWKIFFLYAIPATSVIFGGYYIASYFFLDNYLFFALIQTTGYFVASIFDVIIIVSCYKILISEP